MINDLLKIAFPNNCVSCNNALNKSESFICIKCFLSLHSYMEPIDNSNSLYQASNNKAINTAGAFWEFDKSGLTQKILHELKYNGNKKLGLHLGELIGKEFNFPQKIDYLIPVPLHKRKLKQRGYNQAEVLANGISLVTQIPTISALKRVKYTATQTKKSKEERITNVKKAFDIIDKIDLNNKQVVLIDDVITTGVTINECANTLIKKYPQINLSIYSLAFAKI